jgi:hypothetical protein
MTTEGPSLETLIYRVTSTPADFTVVDLDHSVEILRVRTVAVAHDTAVQLGVTDRFPVAEFERKAATFGGERLRVSLLLCWLIADPSLHNCVAGSDLHRVLTEDSEALANEALAADWLGDAEHREELVRLVLRDLGLRPAGESESQAQDRLSGISSIDRRRVMLETRQAEQRAAAIQKALLEQEAQRSADKATRE